eukprot:COSAG04_NODE_1867_length_5352_cov_1.931658_2_plen_200_part_00
MDAAQRAALEEDGYLVLRGVLSAEESAHLSSLFDSELARLPLEQQASAAGNVYSLRADGSSTRSGEVEDAAAVAVAEPVEDSSVQLEMPRSERGKRIFHSAVHRSLIDRPEVMGILEELCGVRSHPAFPARTGSRGCFSRGAFRRAPCRPGAGAASHAARCWGSRRSGRTRCRASRARHGTGCGSTSTRCTTSRRAPTG